MKLMRVQHLMCLHKATFVESSARAAQEILKRFVVGAEVR